MQETLDGLAKKHLVLERSGFGSRVPKYQHRFCNTGFGSLEFTPQEAAILCELLLRGPQTPGELRARTERLHSFSGADELRETLRRLAERGLVVGLGRRPGQKEERYGHLLAEVGDDGGEPEAPPVAGAPSLEERVSRLEAEVAALRSELEAPT